VARKKINFKELEDAVAVAMYLEFMNDGKVVLSPEMISKLLQNQYPKNAITLLLEDLTKRGVRRTVIKFQLVKDPTDPLDIAVSQYRLTKTCIQYIEDLPDEIFSPLEALCLIEPAKSNNIDDHWSPIAIERIGDKYDDAISLSEKAFDEIKGSNGYAETSHEERDIVVSSVGETLKQIKTDVPTTKDQVISGLVRPLKYISEKFAGASMGEAAKLAVKALLAWLGF